MIAEAGFDGISAHYTNRANVAAINDTIRATGLRIEGVGFPRSVDDLCLPLLDGWMRLSEDAGIPVFIETHRDRMKTDLGAYRRHAPGARNRHQRQQSVRRGCAPAARHAGD